MELSEILPNSSNLNNTNNYYYFFNESQTFFMNNNNENNTFNDSHINRTNRTFPLNDFISDDNMPELLDSNSETFTLENIENEFSNFENLESFPIETNTNNNNNISSIINNNNNNNNINNNNNNNSINQIETSTVNSADIDIFHDIPNINNNNNNKKHSNSPTKKSKISINNSFSSSENSINNNNNNNNNKNNKKININNNNKSLIKSKSSPLIPFNKLENFKTTLQFKYLESAYYYANKLNMIKSQGKFDLESEEGNEICRELLEQIENLIKSYKIKFSNRDYRKKFTKAYIFLYEKDSLGYLTEILDSAQESTPYLVVNGEKYIFSKDVMDRGNQLFISFCNLIVIITEVVNKIVDEIDEINCDFNTLNKINNDIKSNLIDFDKKWTLYEEKYITELIYIEKISRRFIFDGIKIEKELNIYENKAKIKGKILINDKEYNNIREKFINNLNTLNKIANINGKGRDDLDIKILLKSEKVLTTVSEIQSSGLRKLANNIKKCLNDFRNLFKKYNMNIESVDPQLINNPELVNNLYNFEQIWEKGKKYLCNNNKYNQLLHFNQIIQIIIEKYKNFNIGKLIEDSDPQIFVSIPAVLILHAIDSNNYEIIKDYIQNYKNNELFVYLKKTIKNVYKKVGDNYKGYNLFEKFLLFDSQKEEEGIIYELKNYLEIEDIKLFLKNIKILSMNMQRDNPTEWNEFFELAMDI